MAEPSVANPYAAPQAEIIGNPSEDVSAAELIRNEHINHEASLRAVGALYVIGGVLVLLSSLGMLVGTFATHEQRAFSSAALVGLVAALLVISALNIWVGLGLRKLTPKIRTPAIIMSCLNLLNVGIGTIIAIYMLYLLVSRKGSTILSDDYARIRELTPHVKVRTSIITWLALALLIGLMALMALVAR